MTPLDAAFADWEDTLAYHTATLDRLWQLTPEPLKRHREWVEANKYGYGERSFHGVWWLLVQSLPSPFVFCELGVHRGQSISAVDLAAELAGKQATVVGVSPLNGCGGWYEERDYTGDVTALFDTFNSHRRPTLIRRLSTDPAAVTEAAALAPFDALYVDSQHDVTTVAYEVTNYSSLVRRGGYLLFDDAGFGFNLGDTFYGFQHYSDWLNDHFPPQTPNTNWTFIGNVAHLRIYKRI